MTSKFLFFSSVCHLPVDQGCFLLGGSDNEDNYSKRTQFFCKYAIFLEKAPMINKRAFFPSVFTRLDNCIYALGGNDCHSDLSYCEKYSIAENVWRPISPMIIPKNGAAATFMDTHRLIFVFGGNNANNGSLAQIEKYEIDFDKWSLIDLTLKRPIHDLSVLNLGKERVLVMGGHTDSEISKEVQMLDLSLECLKNKGVTLTLKHGGKSYFPPSMNFLQGKASIIFGYCDDKPKIDEVDVADLYLGYFEETPRQGPATSGATHGRSASALRSHMARLSSNRSLQSRKSATHGD